jgi:UDP-N-acetylmuramoylalanine--D-glutamate ligase
MSDLMSKRLLIADLDGRGRAAAEKISAAWAVFTPCTVSGSLLEAVTEASKCTADGDAILRSPAHSRFNQFRNCQERGERFCVVMKSIGRGAAVTDPNINGSSAD